MSSCNCSEKFKEVDGLRIRYPDGEWTRYHKCSYVRNRAALAPKAVQNVIERYGTSNPGPRFTRLFAQEMERLAREAKLI